jgi:hypothetical protein
MALAFQDRGRNLVIVSNGPAILPPNNPTAQPSNNLVPPPIQGNKLYVYELQSTPKILFLDLLEVKE